MRYVTIALALGLMGCGWGRPALMVELNGRKVEFDEYRSGKIPRGVEVSHMDAWNLQVQGSQPIEVNGLPVQADKDSVTIGGRKIAVDPDAQVRVHSGGDIEVKLPPRAVLVQPAAK